VAAPTALPATAEKHPVKVTATPSKERVAAGEQFEVRVRLEIAKGWHINSHEPIQDFLIPTSVTITGALPISAGRVVYPRGEELDFVGETLLVYSGAIDLTAPLTIGAEAAPGAAAIPLRVRFQACDDTVCLSPETLELGVAVEVVAGQ
jgi:DsbC/DsbD-like thiol-disulfide interchange protein